jgi:hypothetical protein
MEEKEIQRGFLERYSKSRRSLRVTEYKRFEDEAKFSRVEKVECETGGQRYLDQVEFSSLGM